tara:strand:- start:783 stop:1964 length:1182 start_codon:yes stop_codon:yes gene_type:complete
MATLTRLHDFETDRDATPPVAISATKVDAELDQLLSGANTNDGRIDAIEANNWVTTVRILDDNVTAPKIDFIDDAIVATDTHIMVGNGTTFTNVIMSGDGTLSNTGVLTISSLAVDTADIIDDAVTAPKVDFIDDALATTSGHLLIGTGTVFTNVAASGDATISSSGVVAISSGVIVNADVNASAAIDYSKLSFSNDIVAGDIAAGAITTTEILDGTILVDDIADGAITTGKILDGTILTGDISTGGITSTNILDGTILNADINASAAIAATKIHDGSITNTEFGYLNGVSSNIQTQISGLVAGVVTDVQDDVFRIQDDADNTKELAFQVSSVATSTVRTITMADSDVDLGNIPVSKGASGQVLTSLGAGASPTFQAPTGATNGFAIAMSVAL